MTYLYAKECVSNHHFDSLPSSLPDGLVTFPPKPSDGILPFLATEPSNLVQKLDYRDFAPQLLRQESDDIYRPPYIVFFQGPSRIVGALTRVVVPVLGSRGTVQVQDDMQGVLGCPGERAMDMGPCACYIWIRSNRWCWDGPVAYGKAVRVMFSLTITAGRSKALAERGSDLPDESQ